MIPNKKKSIQQRGRAMAKTDRMISQIRWEIKTEKKEREKRNGKTDEAADKEKADAKELKPVQAPAPKKLVAKTIDPEAATELLNQLKQKLKIPGDKPISWSYLEYNCIYNGIKLNDLQKKALRQMLAQTEQTAGQK